MRNHLDQPSDNAGETTGSDSRIDAAAARKEKIGRYVFLFVFPFLIVGMLVGGYLAAMSSPAPNEFPVAVFGASLDEQTGGSLDAGAVEIHQAASPDDARQQVRDRDVSGALVITQDAATIYTAGAAGPSGAQIATEILQPFAIDSGLPVANVDLVPLPSHDSAGLTLLFMTTGLVLGAYMPLSLLLGGAPELLRLRRFVPILAGWSAAVSGVVWVIAGPILGGVQGHALQLLAAGWLTVFSVGMVQLLLTRLLGPFAVLAGMLFLMVLGVPSSNLGIPVNTLPSLYNVLHSFLPTPATGEGIRSILYFGSDGYWQHAAVLIVGGIAALVAVAVIDVVRHRRDPERPLPEVTMPSMTGGAPSSTPVRYLNIAMFPLTMVILMVGIMLSAMYQPAPRDLPVAIVAPTKQDAEQVIAGLTGSTGGLFDFVSSTSAQEGERLVIEREVVGAYVLPSSSRTEPELITATAGNTSQQQVVEQLFSAVAGQQNYELTNRDVAPLGASDTLGSTVLYLGIGWVLAGFLLVIVFNSGAPELMRLKVLLPVYVAWAAFIALAIWTIAAPIIGAVDGHLGDLFALGFLTTLTASLFSTVLVRPLGMVAVPIVIGVLMFLGVPASGGGLSIYLEPTLFRVLHDVLPLPAAVEGARSIVYFDAIGLTSHLSVLGTWSVVSLVVCVLYTTARARRHVAPHPLTV